MLRIFSHLHAQTHTDTLHVHTMSCMPTVSSHFSFFFHQVHCSPDKDASANAKPPQSSHESSSTLPRNARLPQMQQLQQQQLQQPPPMHSTNPQQSPFSPPHAVQSGTAPPSSTDRLRLHFLQQQQQQQQVATTQFPFNDITNRPISSASTYTTTPNSPVKRISKSQEFLDATANSATAANNAKSGNGFSSTAASSADSLDKSELAAFDPALSSDSPSFRKPHHLAKSKTLPAGMTTPSAGDLLAMSMTSAEFDAASKLSGPIAKPLVIPAPPTHVKRGHHRRNVSDTSSIAAALGRDHAKRLMMLSTDSPLSNAGLPNSNSNNAAGLRAPAVSALGGSVGSLQLRAKPPHVASMSSLVDAMTSPSSSTMKDEASPSREEMSGSGGASAMHQSLQVAGNARLTSTMDPLSVSTSLLNLSSLKSTDLEQRHSRGVHPQPAMPTPPLTSLGADRHPSAQSLGRGGASSSSTALQSEHPISNKPTFNPFGDTKNFGELTENELFGKEFDEIRMNSSFTSESNSSTTTSNGSATTVVAAAAGGGSAAAATSMFERRNSDEEDTMMDSLRRKDKRASLTLPDVGAKHMTSSMSLNINSLDK